MTPLPYRLLILSLAILALATGWYGYQKYSQPEIPAFRFTAEGLKHLPEFSLPDMNGVDRHSAEWKERVLVINFWATWCPPCREEMPMLIEVQERYRDRGLQIVGIAIDEVDLVKDFSDVYGINFPVMIGGPEAIQLANSLGNKFGTLPFTAIFDRSGNTRYIQAGEITRQTLETQLQNLL